jgi:predicted RNase H-like HicB family nuclease
MPLASQLSKPTISSILKQSEGDAILPKPSKSIAVFREVPEGYIGFVEGLSGANTQGVTLEETQRNLAEAIELVFEANRALAEEIASNP